MPRPTESRLDLTATLRLLWAARRRVSVGAAVGLLAGTLMIYKVDLASPGLQRRGNSSGVASAQVLVDSKSSQAVDLGERPVLIDIPGLIARARLLANLIATSPLRDEIAQRAHIDPDTFLATAPSIGFDSPQSSTPANPPGQQNVMNVTFNESLPIITINSEAADRETAARIASAAGAEVRAYLDTLIAQDKVQNAHQLVIRRLGSADSATVHRGPRRLSAIFAFLFVFGSWCTTIVVVSRLRRMRETGASVVAPPAARNPAGAVACAPRSAPPPSVPPERAERPERPRPGVSA